MKDRKPTPVSKDPLHGDVYEDPTFGVISFSRIHSTGQPLVGSSIKHNNSIMMEVKTAQWIRNLNTDRWFGDKLIVRIEMSPTQFVDAITQLNCGEIPCTIRYTRDGGHIELDAPFESKVTQFDAEFREKIDEVTAEFDDVIKVAEEAHVQKKVLFALKQLKMHIKSNMPFVKEQFTEQMERTVTEAKGEIEATIEGKIRSCGLESLRSDMPQLGESEAKRLTEGKK